MGGYGSGRTGGRPTVESALPLDVDAIMRWGVIRPGAHLQGEVTLHFYDGELAINFESCVGDPCDSWLRLQYTIHDYWTGAPHQIDDKIVLATTRPAFGGLRWWLMCPRLRRRVRRLYLPLGGHHFWSRCAYRLPYSSQRETVHDRAMRRERKLRARLGGDPADDTYPDKPKRMRWATYNRLIDKIAGAERIADQWLLKLAARWVKT
jgi:hypothetical protein